MAPLDNNSSAAANTRYVVSSRLFLRAPADNRLSLYRPSAGGSYSATKISDPAHLGWSVRKAPFAGQGACGKEGTKWQCVLEESSRVQGAASHMGRGARVKMHASRCAHRGVRARKKLAQTTQSGNKVGNPLWIPFSVLRKNWSPVRFPIFVPISVSDAFLASILVFSCEQR